MLAAVLATGGTSLMSATLDGAEWMAVLERLAAALPSEGPPLRLCLIGSAAAFARPARERASENLIYLDVLQDG